MLTRGQEAIYKCYDFSTQHIKYFERNMPGVCKDKPNCCCTAEGIRTMLYLYFLLCHLITITSRRWSLHYL